MEIMHREAIHVKMEVGKDEIDATTSQGMPGDTRS
jgi:hypothetical protein